MPTVITEEWEQLALERSKDFPTEGFVPGRGSLTPRFMMIGEAPGETELEPQMPFTGRAGKELTKFLDHIDVKREEIYITSVFRSRPFTVKQRMDKNSGEIFNRKYNRTPTKKEVLAHAPLLDYEIETIDPPVLLLLGNTALQRVVDKKATVSEFHGRLYEGPIMKLPSPEATHYEKSEKQYRIFTTYHPASIFYNRSLEETIYSDYEALKKYI